MAACTSGQQPFSFNGFGGTSGQSACSGYAQTRGYVGEWTGSSCILSDPEIGDVDNIPVLACEVGGDHLQALRDARVDAYSIAALVFLVMLAIAVHQYFRRAL